MPELARFYGIVITMYFRDHSPPHIHIYGGNRRRPEWAAQVTLRDGTLLDGDAPDVALRLVGDWVALHRDELLEAWRRARTGQEPGRIAPLRLR
jgi:hypothetical protein